MFRSFATTALTLLLALTLGSQARAQDEPVNPQQLQQLMTEAYDHMVSAAELLKGAGDDPAGMQKREDAFAKYDHAVTKYKTVLKGIAGLQGLNPQGVKQIKQIANYNICCALSMQGKKSEAIDHFAKSLEAGYDDFSHMAKDPDLDPIREEARFVQLLERRQGKMAEEAGKLAKAALSESPLFSYDFDVKTLDGKQLKLADLKGKVVIVDYWGTWCGPCKMEIPHFVALKKELGDKLAIVGMTWEGGEAGEAVLARVKEYAQETKINYPLTLLTDREQLTKVPEFNAFPTTLFIDKQGKVRAKEVGYRDLNTLKALVTALDAEGAAPAEKPASEKPASEKKKDDEGSLGPF